MRRIRLAAAPAVGKIATLAEDDGASTCRLDSIDAKAGPCVRE
ncbi:hypothetical protein ACWEQP_16095 [Streptomyces sp. NPDC004044]